VRGTIYRVEPVQRGAPAERAGDLARPPTRATMIVVWGVLYTLATLGLVVYGAHAMFLLRTARRRGPGHVAFLSAARRGVMPSEHDLPRVLVQIPVYDEPRVVARVVEAVAALDWPSDRLAIQLLDDSDDEEARALGAAVVATACARGLDAVHLCRPRREGFKAGALAHGLTIDDAPFVAVFDADFVPPMDFLRRALSSFGLSPRVACVQGRWTHLNRAQNFLTRAQAVAVDAHFLVQQLARTTGAGLVNFNGSAGVWRRAAIDDAGGWSAATLTEDLDLSFRAHLRGWTIVFDPDLVAPAELPPTLAAYKSQQRRWACGSMQCARRLLAPLWRSGLSFGTKLEATLHLFGYAVSAAMVALALLLPLGFGHALTVHRVPMLWPLWVGIWIAALGPVRVALYGQRAARGARLDLGGALAAACVGVGLAANNTFAVVRGLCWPIQEFVRTPKQGRAAACRGRAPRAEVLYAAATAGAAAFLAQHATLGVVAYALFCGSGSWVLTCYWWVRERRLPALP
jgi:cellulose synthase/poly-beta-1,6-N-acetylglucosamine synthase-like glycosyltransferase